MNREILFRGKPKDKDCLIFKNLQIHMQDGFIYGSLIVQDDAYYICTSAIKNSISYINNGLVTMIEVEPETIGQYTGFLDKNDNKIFERDILKCHDNPKNLVEVVFGEFGVVDNDTECPVDTAIGWHYKVIPTDELSAVEPFCLSMPLTKSYIEYCHMEVIGNIHDNHELLEVSE